MTAPAPWPWRLMRAKARQTSPPPVTSSRCAPATAAFWCAQATVFSDVTQGAEHIALSKGDLTSDQPVLTRMHALNPIEDVLGLGPSPASEMQEAMQAIASEGRGVVVLLRDTAMKIDPEGEQSPQTLRQYGLGAQILAALGLSELELLTNSPAPNVVGLDAYGLSITGTRPITGA